MPSTLTTIVDAMSRQGDGNIAVRLVPASGDTLPAFAAGAHVDLHLSNGLIRQYSIASSPLDCSQYTLCIRKEDHSRGGSRHVHETLRVGDLLDISEPRNLFALAEPSDQHVHTILIAGGIGITPLLAMAEQLDAMQSPFELHYYVRRRQDIAFRKRLEQGFAHGKVMLHCSGEGDSVRQGLPGESAAFSDGIRRVFYLCGPNDFMDCVQACALACGVAAQDIHREAFAPVAPSASANAEDGAESSFDVELASSGQRITVLPHQTIAVALMDAGIDIPLSCEMGICGACLTPVLEGDIDHRDTVQSDAEKCGTQQNIALCCSRSRSQRLLLQL